MVRMKTLLFVLCLTIGIGAVAAAKKKPVVPPTVLNQTGYAGVAVGATKAQVAAKGFVCKDEHIGDYYILHECRKPMEYAGRPVDGYVQLNSAGNKAESVGFDVMFPGDQITLAQDQFYKFVKAVEAMLGVAPSSTPTPDTYLGMTNFLFPKTIVSCFLYSDDRTKPPKLRCGVEVRAKK